MFELTEDNFEEMVLDTEDPWILLFTGGMLQKEWKTLAVSLRGVVWFGILNRLEQEDLLEEIVSPVKWSTFWPYDMNPYSLLTVNEDVCLFMMYIF